MANEEEIRTAFKKMAQESGPAVTNLAVVKSVDEAAQTCVLVDEDGLEFFDVRLSPVLTGNQGYLMIPKVGSVVMAVRIEDDEDWMLLAADVLEKVVWITEGGVTAEFSDKVVLKKDDTTVEVGQKIKLQAGNQNFADAMNELFSAIEAMSFVVPGASNTTTLVNLVQFQQVKTKLQQIFE